MLPFHVLSILSLLRLSAAFPPLPFEHSHVLHERRDATPHTWERASRADPEAILPVKIGLLQRNLHKAEEYLTDVSHPLSENFGTLSPSPQIYVGWWTDMQPGKHWSAEKVANTFMPSTSSMSVVEDWLASSGIESDRFTYSTGMW